MSAAVAPAHSPSPLPLLDAKLSPFAPPARPADPGQTAFVVLITCGDDSCTGDTATTSNTYTQYDAPPQRISDFDSQAVPSDGRHRVFNWTVPNPSGSALTKQVIRRQSTTDDTDYYDYIFDCDGSHISCGAAADYASVDQCVNSFSCTQGGVVSVELGSYTGASDSSYLSPTDSYYWKVLGARSPRTPPPSGARV